jgi:hypothetical protein
MKYGNRVCSQAMAAVGVDADEFDPGTQLAFSANGERTVTIAQVSP